MKKLTVLFTLILTVMAAETVMAQQYPGEGRIGLAASIQGGQNEIMVPIWVAENISIAPSLGFVTQEEGPTSLRVGVKPKYYTSIGNGAATFLGFQAAIDYTDPEVGDSDTDFLLGLAGGGDYFFNHHFSIGVEGQLNFFMGENQTISTGAAVNAAYYF